MSGPHIDWDKGGTATVIAIAKDAVKLRSTIPSPPGSRVDGTLRAIDGGAGAKVRFKIHGSKRQPEGDFVLEGRAIDMTREVRDAIDGVIRG